MNRLSAFIAHASQSTASRFTASRLTASRLTASRLIAFRSTASRSTASKYSSNPVRSWHPSLSRNTLNYGFTQSPPPSGSPNSLNHGLQVHRWVHWISRSPSASLSSLDPSVSKCISTLTRSRSPSASLSSLDLNLQVHLQVCSLRASKYIFKERQWVYEDTGVKEVDRVTGSIYSADLAVHRHHLISTSSYHTMKIHTLSFPSFSLTCSVWDFVDLC